MAGRGSYLNATEAASLSLAWSLQLPLIIMCIWWLARCPVTLPAWLKGAVPAVLFIMWFVGYGRQVVDQRTGLTCRLWELSEVLGALCVWVSPPVRQDWWNSVAVVADKGGVPRLLEKTKGKLQTKFQGEDDEFLWVELLLYIFPRGKVW